jgi:acetoacetyl-CoA synthetase
VTDARVLWNPPVDWARTTRIGEYVRWLRSTRGLQFDDYDQLWRWSIADLSGFWTSIWDHYGVRSSTPRGQALGVRTMPGAQWFPGTQVNYARHLLEDADTERLHDDVIAIVAHSQTRDEVSLTFEELREEVARVRAALVRLGVGPGDRVAAYLPNIPETVVAFLATASLGAIWASCAPEFGARSVIDRFGQIAPTVLLGVSGYHFADKRIDRASELRQIADALPSVRAAIHVPYGEYDEAPAGFHDWRTLIVEPASMAYHDVAFDHPLCVLFSSGTTGLPKAIVHGHGGILLEHLKNHGLSWDLGPGDRLLWYSTTAWMMWNALVSGLLVRAGIVLIDGNPLHPTPALQWELAARTRATVVGLSPGFIMACRADGVRPADEHDLSAVRQIGAAGSPLPAEGYRWIADQLPGVLLNVGSGGTDVCTGIVQGSPLQPVVEGEIAGACLGVDARAFDAHGVPVVGELGELVITSPMPSMPVGFWGDTDGSRYRAAYFEEFPGVWRHGDWVRFSEAGSCVIAGRSDATLNRGGVRLGTAEFYRVVEELDGVTDSLVVHLEDSSGGMGTLLLFVVLADGGDEETVESEIRKEIRASLSPRHMPDSIVRVPSVPRNRTGKKLELPVKRILQGSAIEDVVTPGSLAEDDSLNAYVEFSRTAAR